MGDALAPNNFDVADKGVELQASAADVDRQLQTSEVFRRIGYSKADAPDLEQTSSLGVGGGGLTAVSALRNKVSMTRAQYEEYAKEYECESDEGQSIHSLESIELSEDEEGSEDSEFNAQTFMLQHAFREDRSDNVRNMGKIVIDSDAAIKQLMDLPVSDFFTRKQFLDKKQAVAVLQPTSKPATSLREPKSQVFVIRQAIRQLYRSMPHNDFVSLINFLLRGFQAIKHNDCITYWHEDDPVFKQNMGIASKNPYTRKLLKQIGFIKLKDKYWVWPSVHLGDPTLSPFALHRDERNRVDDMIGLLKSCRMSLNKTAQTGTAFTGHFKQLH